MLDDVDGPETGRRGRLACVRRAASHAVVRRARPQRCETGRRRGGEQGLPPVRARPQYAVLVCAGRREDRRLGHEERIGFVILWKHPVVVVVLVVLQQIDRPFLLGLLRFSAAAEDEKAGYKYHCCASDTTYNAT